MMADGLQLRGFVMDRVTIDLANCYGIKRLQKDFDFSKAQAYALYAPNGVMKSSLAQTFQDAVKGDDSKDRIFTARKTARKITDETGADIEGERILVVLPYDPDFGPTEKTSTLLVDSSLRREYEQLHIAIDKAKEELMKAVRQQAGSRRTDFEEAIAATFTNSDDFELAVTRIRDELQRQKDTPFSDIKYDVIFDDAVITALNTSGLKDAIEEYIRRYNELLAASTYFKKGTFDYYNAGEIAKSLAADGFFDANHTVNLKSQGTILEIRTEKELEGIIAKEKDAIITDAELRKKFDAVARQLQRNKALRDFAAYLQDNEAILARMNNAPKFKEDVLKSYLRVHYDLTLISWLNMTPQLSARLRSRKRHASNARNGKR